MSAAALPEGWPAMPVAHANALLAAEGSPLELSHAAIGGVPMKVYLNAPDTMRDVLAASAAFGSRDLIVFEGERVTFETHLKAVAHFADVLKTKFNIQPGDRVAIVMRNYPQWPVAFFAALSIGAIATPMNSWWTGEELDYGLRDSGAKLAVVDAQIYERIREHWANLTDLKNIIIARDPENERADPCLFAMENFIGESNSWPGLEPKPLPDTPLKPESDATIMYTSGTTGRPKGALATHRAIISNMFNGLTILARTFLRRGEAPPEPDPAVQRATLLAIPFFHATGAFSVLCPAILQGNKIVAMYKWDIDKALPMIAEEKVTTVGGVPTIAWQLLEHPDRHKYDLSSIQAVSYGGAPSAPELVTTIKKRLPEAVPGNGWGMTETCAMASANFGEDYINRPDSAGVPPGAVELRVVGPDGDDLPAGEVGELWVKGAMNCKLYWNRPDATAETFIDGWVVTGDLARLDEEGFVYLVDRAKDMLIRGGENIYCIEVESALYSHPAIMDAAIVGIPHKILGEEVGAVVQLTPGASISEEELRHHVAGHLAAFKVPVEIQFETEPLPRNANGKILKTELRDRFKERA
ncbi:MAG: class I adenylate-forming enzyme family protein [Pseudomonadota bacterium]